MTINIETSVNLDVSFDVVVINYNYSEYVGQCIESALAQDHPNVRVIVVDDGSTDDSLEILKSYGESITLISQENAGMMAASNKGFEACSADYVLFLDADDYLYKAALSSVSMNCKKGVAKIHFRLDRRDNSGRLLGTTPTAAFALDSGDVKGLIMEAGAYVSVPTSGNVYSKAVLDTLFPLQTSFSTDSGEYLGQIPTDAFLKLRIPFEGELTAIQESLGVYRIHGANNGARKSPIFSLAKRHRVLWTAHDFTEDVAQKIANDKLFMGESWGVSRSSDILLLRLIAVICREKFIWKDDSRTSLLCSFLQRYFLRGFSTRYPLRREALYLVFFLFICILPGRFAKKIFQR